MLSEISKFLSQRRRTLKDRRGHFLFMVPKPRSQGEKK